MPPKLIPLTTWAQNTYGEDAPTVATLRRWAREANIYPLPVKHGRTYYVEPTAEYVPTGRRRNDGAKKTLSEKAGLARLSV